MRKGKKYEEYFAENRSSYTIMRVRVLFCSSFYLWWLCVWHASALRIRVCSWQEGLLERGGESQKPVLQGNTLGSAPQSHSFISFLEIHASHIAFFSKFSLFELWRFFFFYSSDRKYVDLIVISQNPAQHSTPGNWYWLIRVDERGKTWQPPPM